MAASVALGSGHKLLVLRYNSDAFKAGKPGGESVSASVCTDALPVFSVSVLLYSSALTEFSGQSGRRVRECVCVYRRAPRVFRECSAV